MNVNSIDLIRDYDVRDGRVWRLDCSGFYRIHLDKVIHSNLGHMGPDTGDEGIVYDATGVNELPNGTEIREKLLTKLEAMTPYKPFNNRDNGINGEFASINQNSGDVVEVRVSFYSPDGRPKTISKFSLTVFDLDDESPTQGVEYVVVEDYYEEHRANGTSLKKIELAGGKWEFQATVHGTGADNPSHPAKLSPEQQRKSVEFSYLNKDKFHVHFGSHGKQGGPRYSQFVFNASFQCHEVEITMTKAPPTLWLKTAGPDLDGRYDFVNNDYPHRLQVWQRYQGEDKMFGPPPSENMGKKWVVGRDPTKTRTSPLPQPEAPTVYTSLWVLAKVGSCDEPLSDKIGRYELAPGTLNGFPVWQQSNGPYMLYTGSTGHWIVFNGTRPEDQSQAMVSSIVTAQRHHGMTPDSYEGGWVPAFMEVKVSAEGPAMSKALWLTASSGFDASDPTLGHYTLDVGTINQEPVWQQDSGPHMLRGTPDGKWLIRSGSSSAAVQSRTHHHGLPPDLYKCGWLPAGLEVQASLPTNMGWLNTVLKVVLGVLLLALLAAGVVWCALRKHKYRVVRVLQAEEDLPPFREHAYKNGSVFTGVISNGMRQGKGVQKWADSSSYEGTFKDNVADGRGVFKHADGNVYEGQFKDGKAHGAGKLVAKNGSTYVGEWVSDEKTGQGKETWPDKSSFEGHYLLGKKHGIGHFKWPNGASYQGDFSRDIFHGCGVSVWPDGRRYEGSWLDGKMHGHGVYTWSDGRKYVGQYKTDVKSGHGVFTWPDGRKYDGEWQDGKRHGQGEYTESGGKPAKSEWRADEIVASNLTPL